jgi:tetratricopeptide (TPR) repeat protein
MVMAEPVGFKYRAFISYSHADASWAKWLHRALESFTIDKDLVGRETANGPVPKALRPIFRDRDEFTAGHSLNEQTLAALDASHALIVICSPAAAKSRYVTEEVRLFKSRHPERPVIPLIAGGRPGDAEAECFPPALKFKLDAEGKITDEPVEVLAADAREEGDGKQLALAKIVAGLLGLSSDDVFRRAERERRRRGRVRNGIIAALAVLAIAATGSAAYAWQQLKTNEAFLSATLQRATGIVNMAVSQAETYGVPRKATLALLTQAEGLFDDMARLGRPTPDLRYQKAWMLIQFARNYEILGDTANQKSRAEEARQIMAELAAEMPDDPEKLRTLSAALNEQGEVLVVQGNLTEALKTFRDSLTIADRLAKADPGNADWQRNLSIPDERIGDVLVAQGKLAEALASYQDCLDIRERLANADPGNASWQRDLSVSYEKIGEVLLAQGNLAGALQSFRTSRP